ncbi:MAG: arginase [Rhodospirillales bacterium]|nr:arginase [Rhodospirillales bacterium]MDE2576562.1 arginase [Rhodospirillales bacterium]
MHRPAAWLTARATHAVSLLGIPLELGAGEPGGLMGPAAMRTAGLAGLLKALGHHVTDHGDMAPPAPVAAGVAENCRNAGQIAAWTRAIHGRAHALARAGGIPVFLGGDHSLSMGTVSGVARHCAEAGRELVVLWLDAHADCNTPATTPSGNLHGMSAAFACGEASLRPLLGTLPFHPIAPGRLHLFGLRSIDAGERRAIAARGINSIDMRMIDEHGVGVLLGRILDGLDPARTHLHVSLDVDFLDPSLAPGVGTTVPGGATYREAHLIMEMLHDCGLVGSLDVVELNPFLDERGRSARLLAELIASLFGRTVIDRPAARAA